MLEIVIVTGVRAEEGGPARDQDHDRARAHVPARDPVAIARARLSAADPAARAPGSEISIVSRNASLFPKIESSRKLDRAPDHEADKLRRYDLKSTTLSTDSPFDLIEKLRYIFLRYNSIRSIYHLAHAEATCFRDMWIYK